jgi:hypothetical protein
LPSRDVAQRLGEHDEALRLSQTLADEEEVEEEPVDLHVDTPADLIDGSLCETLLIMRGVEPQAGLSRDLELLLDSDLELKARSAIDRSTSGAEDQLRVGWKEDFRVDDLGVSQTHSSACRADRGRVSVGVYQQLVEGE